MQLKIFDARIEKLTHLPFFKEREMDWRHFVKSIREFVQNRWITLYPRRYQKFETNSAEPRRRNAWLTRRPRSRDTQASKYITTSMRVKTLEITKVNPPTQPPIRTSSKFRSPQLDIYRLRGIPPIPRCDNKRQAACTDCSVQSAKNMERIQRHALFNFYINS